MRKAVNLCVKWLSLKSHKPSGHIPVSNLDGLWGMVGLRCCWPLSVEIPSFFFLDGPHHFNSSDYSSSALSVTCFLCQPALFLFSLQMLMAFSALCTFNLRFVPLGPGFPLEWGTSPFSRGSSHELLTHVPPGSLSLEVLRILQTQLSSLIPYLSEWYLLLSTHPFRHSIQNMIVAINFLSRKNHWLNPVN